MLCPHCQQAIPDDSRFCPFCGGILSEPPGQTAEAITPKKKRSPKRMVLFTALGVIAVLLCVYLGTYIHARNCAIKEDFSGAQKSLLFPAVTRIHDPNLLSYVSAGMMFERGNYEDAQQSFARLAESGYLKADFMNDASGFLHGLQSLIDGNVSGYRKIEELAKAGFPLAADGLADAKQIAYENGIRLYRAGTIHGAKSFFEVIDPYYRSSDYLTLIYRNNYNAVIQLVGFEDADAVLLNEMANLYLTGTWKTSDGKNYFAMKEKDDGSHSCDYNLPHVTMNNAYYHISDGVYYLYSKDTTYHDWVNGEFEKKSLFRFSIIDADTITVYCYKDGSTYKLFRQ